MVQLTKEAILAFMKKHNYTADIQNETGQVFTIFKMKNRECPVFLRIFEESQLLQILAFVPCPLEPKLVPDMARLLHLLNKEVDLPGFGMDELSGVVFYRLMIPAFNKKVDDDVLEGYLKTVKNVCELFLPAIETVAFGHATIDDIFNKMNIEPPK